MARIRERSGANEKNFSAPQGGPGKLKVNCLVVIVKIMFKWCNNVVGLNWSGGLLLFVCR